MIALADTVRIRWLPVSAMNRLPKASTATPYGTLSCASVAGPPSPLNPAVPVPATVVIIPPADTFRIRWLPASAMNRLPAASTNTPAGLDIWAAMARPPSPLNPAVPVPATVVIIPPADTFRIRELLVSDEHRLPNASTATPFGKPRLAAVAGPPSPPNPL